VLNPLLSSSLRVKSTKLRTTPVSDAFFEVVASDVFLVVTLVVFFEVVTSVVSFEEAASVVSLEVVSGSADFLLRVLRVLPATLVEVESSVVDLVSF
jgi:hypothetical protein